MVTGRDQETWFAQLVVAMLFVIVAHALTYWVMYDFNKYLIFSLVILLFALI